MGLRRVQEGAGPQKTGILPLPDSPCHQAAAMTQGDGKAPAHFETSSRGCVGAGNACPLGLGLSPFFASSLMRVLADGSDRTGPGQAVDHRALIFAVSASPWDLDGSRATAGAGT